MKTRFLVPALAAAVCMAGFAPSEAVAKPKHYKKAVKHYRKDVRHYYNHSYYRPYRVHYDRPDYDSESWGVNITPGGGVGFYYSESNGAYGYPYYGYY